MSSPVPSGNGSRRLLLICAVLSLFAGCGGRAGDPVSVAKARNLVVVCLDTVRYDVFSLPETAGLTDDLSAQLERALVFDRGQSTAPWTVPAVASLLTGLYPNQHGAGRFGEEIANLSDTVPTGIRGDAETLPELLSSSGFSTAAFVAHPWFSTGYDLDRGFGSLELSSESLRLTGHSLEWLDELSTAQQTASQERPFFVYLHFMEAHEAHRKPIEKIEEVVGKMSPEVRDASAALASGFACSDTTSSRCHRFLAYVDSVLELRGQVASLVEGLAKRRLLDDTVVVVYSDHGEEFGDHVDEGRAEGQDPRGIYGAGHGHTLYQELLHVPLVIWHPGRPGRGVKTPVTLVDIVPSLIDWLSLSRRGAADRDLPGLLIDELLADGPHPRRFLYSSGIAYGRRQMAVFDGRWKRIHFPGQSMARLFDLERDPREKAPIVDRRLALSLDRQLSRHLELTVAPTGGQNPEIPPEFLKQLQTLGYLEGAHDQSEAAGEDSR